MKVIRLCYNAVLPKRGSDGAAGYDLSSIESIILHPGTRKLISTGISVKLPSGVYGRVAPRSGLTVKYGIHVGAGVIDPDYTGEIKVALFNHGDTALNINIGDRIAQLILENFTISTVEEVFDIDETSRGNNGFGSTGTQ